MTSQEQGRRTPLYGAHVGCRARIVDFAGWDMPVFYTGILEEARAVRTAAGIFDVSHMGRLRIYGADATAYLQKLTSNDVAALRPSEAQYSLLMHPSGGIIDDIIVYREAEDAYMVVINAGNAAKDLAWMEVQSHGDVSIEDRSAETAMIAVQGPHAPALVARLTGAPELLGLKRFQYATGNLFGASAILCRTGYTGEDGFELIVPAEQADSVWNGLVAEGATPCGLGARDALRIEAGYPLYGHEIDETTTPVEAGLMWVTKLEKGDFFGRDGVIEMKRRGASRKLMGLVLRERIVPRQGYTIYMSGSGHPGILGGAGEIGTVTSGIFSPTRNHSIAMGYISTEHCRSGESVEIGIRDKRVHATVVQKKSLLVESEE